MTSLLTQYREALAEQDQFSPDARLLAKQSMNRARREQVNGFAAQTLLRVVNTADRQTEHLLWFWFNHFNVYWPKGLVGFALEDYVENALRPNIYGRFSDLLRAVLTHPAMLIYLDNVGNVAGKGNENLARELLELHTLGVDGGHTQIDVRETARVLTGLGMRPLKPVRRNPSEHALARQNGEFLFNPYQHETGPKNVLGCKIESPGFAEIDQLIELLATHPATARHLVGKLARHLYGDMSSEAQRDHATRIFRETGGDLRGTVEALTGCRES